MGSVSRVDGGLPVMKLPIIAALCALMFASGVQAKRLDLANPADAITAYRKVQCSAVDGVPVVYHWSGHVYSRVPGEPDRHIFNVEGMNVRACVTVDDPARGKGFRMVSRELMFYLDPKTGAVLKTWTNPWSGETVDVIPVANDPVNMRPMFPIGADGKPFTMDARAEGGRLFMTTEVPLFYKNPLAGDYQDFIGNHYHAMEMFDFIDDEADLLDAAKPIAHPVVAWVRVAQWLPWMKMGDREGVMVVNATGETVSGVDALPAVIKDEIAATYPAWREPPPLDDRRPNETSWTYFKKHQEAKAATGPK